MDNGPSETSLFNAINDKEKERSQLNSEKSKDSSQDINEFEFDQLELTRLEFDFDEGMHHVGTASQTENVCARDPATYATSDEKDYFGLASPLKTCLISSSLETTAAIASTFSNTGDKFVLNESYSEEVNHLQTIRDSEQSISMQTDTFSDMKTDSNGVVEQNENKELLHKHLSVENKIWRRMSDLDYGRIFKEKHEDDEGSDEKDYISIYSDDTSWYTADKLKELSEITKQELQVRNEFERVNEKETNLSPCALFNCTRSNIKTFYNGEMRKMIKTSVCEDEKKFITPRRRGSNNIFNKSAASRFGNLANMTNNRRWIEPFSKRRQRFPINSAQRKFGKKRGRGNQGIRIVNHRGNRRRGRLKNINWRVDEYKAANERRQVENSYAN